MSLVIVFVTMHRNCVPALTKIVCIHKNLCQMYQRGVFTFRLHFSHGLWFCMVWHGVEDLVSMAPARHAAPH